MLGGSISTGGNLIFIGANADNDPSVFDMTNGEQLWQARLPSGGHGSFSTKMGDYIVAYALPDK